MIPTIYEAKAPTSVEALTALESRLGITLPDDYRSWLLQFNGGRPDRGRFRYKHETGPYTDGTVAWFLAVYDGEYSNFEFTFRKYKVRARRLPSDLVAIAKDPFGNLICLSVVGDDRGAVYFWDHEEEGPEGSEPTYGNCHLVADSFTEFINNLS